MQHMRQYASCRVHIAHENIISMIYSSLFNSVTILPIQPVKCLMVIITCLWLIRALSYSGLKCPDLKFQNTLCPMMVLGVQYKLEVCIILNVRLLLCLALWYFLLFSSEDLTHLKTAFPKEHTHLTTQNRDEAPSLSLQELNWHKILFYFIFVSVKENL